MDNINKYPEELELTNYKVINVKFILINYRVSKHTATHDIHNFPP